MSLSASSESKESKLEGRIDDRLRLAMLIVKAEVENSSVDCALDRLELGLGLRYIKVMSVYKLGSLDASEDEMLVSYGRVI